MASRKTSQDVHISHSQVQEFVQCPRRYHLHRRLGLSPEFAPSGLLFGSAVHEALALLHQRWLEGRKASIRELQRAFEHPWKAEKLPVRYGSRESSETLKSLASAILEHYMAHRSPEGEVLAVEEAFEIRLSDTIPPIAGRIDLVELDPNGCLVVSDVKTAKSAKEPEPDQLVLYCEAVKQLGYPGDGQIRCRYVVLTKSASPEVVVYEPAIGPEHLDRLKAQYEQVWQAIQSGISFARPDWWCRGCQWSRYCDAGPAGSP